jgi:hypothetical protein
MDERDWRIPTEPRPKSKVNVASLTTRPYAPTPIRPYAHTPIRPYAHTPTRPHAHTPTRPDAHTPTRPHVDLTLPAHRDVGRFDQSRDAIAYFEFHVSYRTRRDDGGHLADGRLDDDFTEHLIRDDLFHRAGYFVTNRLFHTASVRFGHRLRNQT